MSNCNNCCGLGTQIILPNDPSGSVSINAQGVIGGVKVTWSYPTVNGHAVTYWKVFRASSNNFSSAQEIAKVSGSQHIDSINEERMFFYWVQSVSVNGTEGQLAGPASATPITRKQGLIDDLHETIDKSFLANHLREPIESITRTYDELVAEVNARRLSHEELSRMINSVRSGLQQAGTLIHREATQRVQGQNALAEEILVMGAANQRYDASLIELRRTVAESDRSMAEKITQLTSRTNNAVNTANQAKQAISTATETLKTETKALNDTFSQKITDLSSQNDRSIATAKQELKTEIKGEVTQATSKINLAVANVNNTASAIRQEMQAVTTKSNATASKVTTLESTVNGVTAKVQETAKTVVDEKLGAMSIWSAKVDVNNNVGGFALLGTNKSIDAGFDVDTFWIGRGNNKTKPFIVQNGTVYIDKVRIGEGWIGTNKIEAGAISKTILKSKEGADAINVGPIYGISANNGITTTFDVDEFHTSVQLKANEKIFLILNLNFICTASSRRFVSISIPEFIGGRGHRKGYAIEANNSLNFTYSMNFDNTNNHNLMAKVLFQPGIRYQEGIEHGTSSLTIMILKR